MFWLTLAAAVAFIAGRDPRLPVRGRAAVRRDADLDAHDPPADWLAARARYCRINAVRTACSLAALVLLVAALSQPTP